MRTTVGPLPAAVYWRRRFLVLGALLVLVLGVAFACSGSDDQRPTGSAGAIDQQPAGATPTVHVLTPEVDQSFEETGSPRVPARPAPDNVPAGPAPDGSGAPPAGVAQPTGACTDAEMQVTPVPGRISAKRGQPIDLRLRIKNTSNRTCMRDVGAGLQELYVKQGAHKIWSSDACGLSTGSKVLQFTPNYEREYRVTWNGRTSSQCAGGTATGPLPPAGAYQLFGRLGAKVSAPVQLALV